MYHLAVVSWDLSHQQRTRVETKLHRLPKTKLKTVVKVGARKKRRVALRDIFAVLQFFV